MQASVVLLDYGMGNVQSVANAVEWLGVPVRVSSDARVVEAASHLILPGVGSFRDGMQRLRATALDDLLQDQVLRRGKPFLGICLGMQLMAEVGDEGGETRGLGWIAARVKKLDATQLGLKVPHMGWNEVCPRQGSVLYDGLLDDPTFYFVHSYYLAVEEAAVVSGMCEYGSRFCASVEKGHIFGTQFHPEKSQRDGLRVLKNFVEFAP